MIRTVHGQILSAKDNRLTPLLTNVRVFSTHYGNGNTTQYEDHPLIKGDFDKLFDANNAATTLSWSGDKSASTVLNWTVYTTLTGAGVGVPNGGNYFSVEVSFVFVPKETGTYSFSIDSDDGSDLYIDGNEVATYYDGHGTGQGSDIGTYAMVAGAKYSCVARTQEYTGGEGLVLKWKRPSQGIYSLQTSEVFQPE